MTSALTAQQAIDQSIWTNSTIHLSALSADEHATLLVECEDAIEPYPGVFEYWGERDGSTWRVHVGSQTDDEGDDA